MIVSNVLLFLLCLVLTLVVMGAGLIVGRRLHFWKLMGAVGALLVMTPMLCLSALMTATFIYAPVRFAIYLMSEALRGTALGNALAAMPGADLLSQSRLAGTLALLIWIALIWRSGSNPLKDLRAYLQGIYREG